MSDNPSQDGTGAPLRDHMDAHQSDLDMVKQHVTNSEVRIETQRKLIAILAAQRQPLKQARELLHLFEVTLQAHVDHLVHVEEIAGHRARPRRSGERVGRRSR